MKFLLVDDEFASRKKAQEMLSQYEKCDVAVNGLEALNAFIRAHHENDLYKVIFLDIDMPEIDGNLVLSKIRQWEASRNILPDKIAKVFMILAHNSGETHTSKPIQDREHFLQNPSTAAGLTMSSQLSD